MDKKTFLFEASRETWDQGSR